MSEARVKARELRSALEDGSRPLRDAADATMVLAQALGVIKALCDEGDALESRVKALEGEIHDEWIRRRTVEQDRDAARDERAAALREVARLRALGMSIKPKSAEELHRGGQRTSLDLAVELLRHVIGVCPDGCRYCVRANLFNVDAVWLVARETARSGALTRATELERLVVRGEATDADWAEYRKLKDSDLIGAEDAILIQLRAFNAQVRERGELPRERDKLLTRLAVLESKPTEDPDELRQRLLWEAAEQLPDGWSIIPEELRPGRYRVHHNLWPASPVSLNCSLDDACFWWTCGAVTVTGRFARLADTSLRNYPDLVSLIRTGKLAGGLVVT